MLLAGTVGVGRDGALGDTGSLRSAGGGAASTWRRTREYCPFLFHGLVNAAVGQIGTKACKRVCPFLSLQAAAAGPGWAPLALGPAQMEGALPHGTSLQPHRSLGCFGSVCEGKSFRVEIIQPPLHSSAVF